MELILNKSIKEVGKPSLPIFVKKVTTGAHSKGSNSSGFNPILQKLYKMICEIIASKTVEGIFLIFWWRTVFQNQKISVSEISGDHL